MKDKIPVTVSLSSDLVKAIDFVADDIGFSRSMILQMAVENGIDQVRSQLYRARPKPTLEQGHPQPQQTVTQPA